MDMKDRRAPLEFFWHCDIRWTFYASKESTCEYFDIWQPYGQEKKPIFDYIGAVTFWSPFLKNQIFSQIDEFRTFLSFKWGAKLLLHVLISNNFAEKRHQRQRSEGRGDASAMINRNPDYQHASDYANYKPEETKAKSSHSIYNDDDPRLTQQNGTVDGFRVDAAKSFTVSFLKTFSKQNY